VAAMDVFVNQVVAELRPMLAPDGGSVELVSCDDGLVHVRYFMGHNEECADCVMSPEDFELYLKELLTERVPGFKELKVTEATGAAS
jgi:Fe-S cluster biogenesis protein NfuA